MTRHRTVPLPPCHGVLPLRPIPLDLIWQLLAVALNHDLNLGKFRGSQVVTQQLCQDGYQHCQTPGELLFVHYFFWLWIATSYKMNSNCDFVTMALPVLNLPVYTICIPFKLLFIY